MEAVDDFARDLFDLFKTHAQLMSGALRSTIPGAPSRIIAYAEMCRTNVHGVEWWLENSLLSHHECGDLTCIDTAHGVAITRRNGERTRDSTVRVHHRLFNCFCREGSQ
jgi:hypothetical protein